MAAAKKGQLQLSARTDLDCASPGITIIQKMISIFTRDNDAGNCHFAFCARAGCGHQRQFRERVGADVSSVVFAPGYYNFDA